MYVCSIYRTSYYRLQEMRVCLLKTVRNSEIEPTFAVRIDFEMFQIFVTITPLYPPREAGNFEIPSTFQGWVFVYNDI